MDPATLAIIGGALVGVGTAAFSEWWSAADERAKKALLEQAQQVYANMSPPEIAALQAQQMGPSAYEALPTDFGNKEIRNRALARIAEMGMEGGMDAGSMLALEQARRAGAQQSTQGEQAVRQEFARRGLHGAGEAVLAQQAQQAGAQTASLAGLQAASDARSRALQALSEGRAGAQSAESADYGQAAARAAAMDRIAEFNARMRQDTNTFNAGLAQQNFQNRLGLADRNYGALRARAGDYESEAERKRRIAGGVGQSLMGSLGALGRTGGVP
jgi:hypothetical protein